MMNSTSPQNSHPHFRFGRALGACLICAFAAFAAPAVAQATTDLGVAQTDTPDPVRSGHVLIYKIQVANAGPDAARRVRLLDKLSPKVDFLTASSQSASCGHQGRWVRCSVGTLAAGARAMITIRVRPTIKLERAAIGNFITVGKRKSDPRPTNNQSTIQTTVENPPPVICAGRVANIVGTDGDDSLFGTNAPDVIAALSGDDVIVGLGGGDVVCASGGRDKVRGNGGADRLKGGGGDDKLKGGDDDDQLLGKGGRDKLRGGRGNDVLRGGHGKDRCRGEGGADIKRSC